MGPGVRNPIRGGWPSVSPAPSLCALDTGCLIYYTIASEEFKRAVLSNSLTRNRTVKDSRTPQRRRKPEFAAPQPEAKPVNTLEKVTAPVECSGRTGSPSLVPRSIERRQPITSGGPTHHTSTQPPEQMAASSSLPTKRRSLRTDRKGRFRIEALSPDYRFRLTVGKGELHFGYGLGSGQTVDLGDVTMSGQEP